MINLAFIEYEKGDIQKSEKLCRDILKDNPFNEQVLYLMGMICIKKNDVNSAIEYFKKTISINPLFINSYRILGSIYCELGRYEDAISNYKKLIEFDNNSAEVFIILGGLLNKIGCLQEATLYYEKALNIKPDFPEAFNDLAVIFYENDFLTEALECCKKAIFLKPDYVKAMKNLGMILNDLGKTKEAIEVYKNAYSICGDESIILRIATIMPPIMQSWEEIHFYRNNCEKIIDETSKNGIVLVDPVEEIGRANFYFAYHGLNDKPIMAKMAELFKNACPSLNYTAAHCLKKRKNNFGKVKIGFISRHLQNHTVGKYIRGIIEKLSRELFEVYVFTFSEKKDYISSMIKSSADHAIRLNLKLEKARLEIANQELDMLFYPDIGMEPFTYFLAFSRLARIQCVFYGHPDTTGIKNIDYFITQEDCETKNFRSFYSETPLVLSNNVCYTYYYKPTINKIFKTRKDLGFNETDHIYLCPQSLFKIHPDFDEIVATILEYDKKGIVGFFEGTYRYWTDKLIERFQRNIPSFLNRIIFIPRQAYQDYLNLINISDVILDTLYFNGGNTTFDCFALGAPVVTLPGDFLRGRQTYSLYKRMGIIDCVAKDKTEYVGIALRIAQDAEYKKKLREIILENNYKIFEDIKMIRELEDKFLNLVAGM